MNPSLCLRHVVATWLLCVTVAALGLMAPAHAAAKTKPAAPSEGLTIELNEQLKPGTGDLDAMIERHVIRVLVVYGKTQYFVDKAPRCGATYDAFRLFEEDLNKRLRGKKSSCVSRPATTRA
jgi:hypothetical protein